ncbi:DNA mismatch repair protein MutS [bacterium BMS3Abin07]|nr:DNA mismatch repair protein MutS [bacterium BMS3Abin07]GBE31990.1 DNA mismatch repair protein MutS [bacterium BMS3Bbin05]
MDVNKKTINSSVALTSSTPLMKQYASIKEDHKDAILFFRLGDFYEMFGEDAVIASKILQITLTTRDKNSETPIPMCGIPHFSAAGYITKLINSGRKVAVCEQMEDTEDSSGIVRREVVRVITPGTHEPENPKESSYIMSVFPHGNRHSISMAEISTGEFLVYESDGSLEDEISLAEPREILCPESLRQRIGYSSILKGQYVTYIDDWFFDQAESYKRLLEYFRVTSLEGYGCETMPEGISAAGALLYYLIETQGNAFGFKRITTLNKASFMLLDASTKKNLELLVNLKDGTQNESLLNVLDQTLTSMGGRLLRTAIVKPLTHSDEIGKRHDAVESLVNDFESLENIRQVLRNVHDLERLAVRLSTLRVNARDLAAIKNSIALIPKLRNITSKLRSNLIENINDELDDFTELKELLGESIVDSPPPGIREGGIIKKGYSREVDELRDLSSNSREFLARFEAEERKSTGIGSLKVGYNKVHGYYIEVTRTNLSHVPEHYIRKQTLINSERFITPELKDYESKILGSEEKLKNLEYHIFRNIIDKISVYADRIQATASAIALLDLIVSLATAARRYNYVKPQITDSGRIEIIEGRHPVLERIESDERFIPNNSIIDTDEDFLLIITGPNMAGKSTYMRQAALIVLMAQMGSFVPAEKAAIGVADRIFTRIGASDFLSRGQSTFMVEMIETANIINNATEKSLILLDEVGRGTSTFDGISIAWAVAEYIATKIRARTMFATHYNELTELSLSLEGVRNLNIAVKEWGDEIIFLRKIEKGPADKSYGIQVARLAGLPVAVLERAREVLRSLEEEDINETGESRFAGRKGKKKSVQLDLFGLKAHPAIKELNNASPESMTPEEALQFIFKLKELSSHS